MVIRRQGRITALECIRGVLLEMQVSAALETAVV